MKTKIIKISIAVLVAFGAQNVVAQEFKWGMRFDTNFDNREYTPVEVDGIVNSKTYFSVRLAPVAGIGWGDGHSLMTGASYTLDMGAAPDTRKLEPLAYYNYHSSRFRAYAGKFERRHLVGAYSRAIYAGSSTFYDNVIDGFALQYTPVASYLELVLDWDGMKATNVRESFRVLSAGAWNPVLLWPVIWLTAGYSLNVYHLASSAGAREGVVEHILVNPYAGAAFERLATWFQRLTLTAGWLNSFDRERAGENAWKKPGGITVDFTVQKWNVGIRNRLYIGDKQFPFYETYGSRVYRGDQFYSISGKYNLTQIYWHPKIGQGVNLDLEMGLHWEGSGIGLQQVARIGISLDSSFFKKK